MMNLKNHLPFVLLVMVLLATGLYTYKEYGTPWDEYMQREMGRYNYNYLTSQNDSLLSWRCRDYGVVVELPLYVLEKKIVPNQPAASIFLRHLACYMLYLIGLVFFYLSLLKLKFKPIWALAGVLMLVVSPRIYGHAYINSKDIPLMVFYIISFYTMLCFIEKPSWKSIISHAFACALLIDTRISGIIILPATVLFFAFYEYAGNKQENQHFFKIFRSKKLASFLVFNAIFVYIMWPFLWLNPIKNFLVAFLNMSQFRWKGYNLLFGELIKSTEIPWHFGFTWLGITTPLLYLLLFAAGLFYFLLKTVKKQNVFKSVGFLEMLMPFCMFAGPIIATILFKSVLYDTWRHIYFVYPFFIIIALYGAQLIYMKIKSTTIKWVLMACCCAYMANVVYAMKQAFPHEYVYFNELIGASEGNIRKNYDMDYWGLSYRKGLEYILKNDKATCIKITANEYPCYANYVLLSDIYKNCPLKYVLKEEEADYYLTNYRYKPNDHINSKYREYYTIKYKKSNILGVYKLR